MYNRTWQVLKEEIEEGYGYYWPSKVVNKDGNVVYWPRDTWFNSLIINICTLLIQLRLFIMSEPFFFMLMRFICFYWLIFNKYLILTYFLSLIIIASRLILLFQCNNNASFLSLVKRNM